MNDSAEKNASSSDKDGDGIRIIEHGGTRSRATVLYKLLAVLLFVCFTAYLVKLIVLRVSSESADAHSVQAVSDHEVSVLDEVASSDRANENHDQVRAQPVERHARRDPNDLSNYVARGQTPKMEEVIERLHEAGIHSGIGAFNPPGTSPPMIGLAVPEDYVLPEGYVRHYQATDDGQRIEPILMYSPDFEFFDNAGQRIVVPENRVVPGNMAPPGLAIRPIQIPKPLEPGGP